MSQITITAECNPTEDVDKVRKSILNIFPDSEIRRDGGLIALSSKTERLKELVWEQKIIDTARMVLKRGRSGNATSFQLNKQVAYTGKVSFIEEPSPLGNLRVTIEDQDIEALIADIAPETENGEVVS